LLNSATIRYNNDYMKATKHPSPPATLYACLNLAHRPTNHVINFLGLALLFIFGWLFLGLVALLHPHLFTSPFTFYWRSITLPGFLLMMLLIVVLHELTHWLGYWLVIGERPFIRPNFLYYYAAAPDWYIPRPHYIFIRLLPTLLLTLMGLILLPTATPPTVHYLTIALPINAAGSVIDFVVVGWLLWHKKKGLVQDKGPLITLYIPSDIL
jgi:hypothetical protein